MAGLRRMSFRDDFHGTSFDSLKEQRRIRAEERERKQKEKIEKVLQEAAARKIKEEEERLEREEELKKHKYAKYKYSSLNRTEKKKNNNNNDGKDDDDDDDNEEETLIYKHFMLRTPKNKAFTNKLSKRSKDNNNNNINNKKNNKQTSKSETKQQSRINKEKETKKKKEELFRMRKNTIKEILGHRNDYLNNYEIDSLNNNSTNKEEASEEQQQQTGNNQNNKTTLNPSTSNPILFTYDPELLKNRNTTTSQPTPDDINVYGNYKKQTKTIVTSKINNNNNTNNNINATSTITNKSTTKIIFKAIYPFAANGDKNMTNLIPDERCIVIRKGKRGWWLISKLLCQTDQGYVPSTYLTPCDEVYCVNNTEEEIEIVENINKNENEEVTMSNNNNNMRTKPPQYSTATNVYNNYNNNDKKKKKKNTNIIRVKKEIIERTENILERDDTSTTQYTKKNSAKPPPPPLPPKITNDSFRKTIEVQHISNAISDMSKNPNIEKHRRITQALFNTFGTTKKMEGSAPPPPPIVKKEIVKMPPPPSYFKAIHSSNNNNNNNTSNKNNTNNKNKMVTKKKKDGPFRWRGAKIPPFDPNQRRSSTVRLTTTLKKKKEQQQRLSSAGTTTTNNNNNTSPRTSPTSIIHDKNNKALANKRRKESIAKDRVHGFVPHGAIKNHQHTFYWPKQPMMATTTTTTPNNESEKENPNKNDESTFAAADDVNIDDDLILDEELAITTSIPTDNNNKATTIQEKKKKNVLPTRNNNLPWKRRATNLIINYNIVAKEFQTPDLATTLNENLRQKTRNNNYIEEENNGQDPSRTTTTLVTTTTTSSPSSLMQKEADNVTRAYTLDFNDLKKDAQDSSIIISNNNNNNNNGVLLKKKNKVKFTIDGRFNKPNSSSSKHQKRVNINTFQHSNIIKKKTHGEQYKYVQNLGYVLIHTKKKVEDMNENQYDTTYDNNKKKQHGGQKTTIKNAKSTLDLFRKVNGLKVSSVDVKKQQEERLRRRTMMSSPRSSSSSSTNTITTSNNKHQRMMKKRQQQKTRYSRSASHSATSRLSPFNSPDSNSSGGEGGYDSDDSRRRYKSLSPTDKISAEYKVQIAERKELKRKQREEQLKQRRANNNNSDKDDNNNSKFYVPPFATDYELLFKSLNQAVRYGDISLSDSIGASKMLLAKDETTINALNKLGLQMDDCEFSEDLALKKSTETISKMNQDKMKTLLENQKMGKVVDEMMEKNM